MARRTPQVFDIKGTVVKDWNQIILGRVDGRERGMPALTRDKQIADTKKWTLAPRARQFAGQRREFDKYEGKATGLISTIVHEKHAPLNYRFNDSVYLSHGKRTQPDMEVYQLERCGNQNWYINREAYKVSSRTSEIGPWAAPQ